MFGMILGRGLFSQFSNNFSLIIGGECALAFAHQSCLNCPVQCCGLSETSACIRITWRLAC